MITNENLAALPGIIALTPASAWIAATGLVLLAVVILVRLSRERNLPAKRTPDVREEEFRPGILFGAGECSKPESCADHPGLGNPVSEKRSDPSREHVP